MGGCFDVRRTTVDAPVQLVRMLGELQQKVTVSAQKLSATAANETVQSC